MRNPPDHDAIEASVEAVRVALRDLVDRSHLSLRALDSRFGLGKNFFSNVFSGRKELRVAHVAMVLQAVGGSPSEFWASVYAQPASAPVPGRGQEDDQRLNALIEAKVQEALERLSRKSRGVASARKQKGARHA